MNQQTRCRLCHGWMPSSANFCGACGERAPDLGALPPKAPPEPGAVREATTAGLKMSAIALGVGLWIWAASQPRARPAQPELVIPPEPVAAAPAPNPITSLCGGAILPCGHPTTGCEIGGGSGGTYSCDYGHTYRLRGGLFYPAGY